MTDLPSTNARKNLLLALMLLVAGVLVIKSVSDNLLSIQQDFANLNWPMMVVAALSMCGSLMAQGLYNLSLVSERHTTKLYRIRILCEYFMSQLVRYLPGKIWGIYYQSERTRQMVPRHVVWNANIVQFVDVNLFSAMVISGLVSHVLFGFYIALLQLVVLLIGFYWLQKKALVSKLIFNLTKLLNIDTSSLLTLKAFNKHINVRFFLLFFDWLCFVVAWWAIALNYMQWLDAAILSILYAAASLVGLAVVIMPSGLIVREASFIALAVWFGYDEGLVILLSVIARLLLTIADIVVGMISFLVIRRQPQLSV